MNNVEDTLHEALVTAVSEYGLSEHDFIRRFASGGFSQDAIREWASKMLPGSNRFNQAFLRVTSQIDDYDARVLMLRNVYSEHGELSAKQAHVALFMRFMAGIGCREIDVHGDDGAFREPELRFK